MRYNANSPNCIWETAEISAYLEMKCLITPPNMHKDYFSKAFQLEAYIFDKVEDKEFEVHIHCHVKKRGM